MFLELGNGSWQMITWQFPSHNILLYFLQSLDCIIFDLFDWRKLSQAEFESELLQQVKWNMACGMLFFTDDVNVSLA